MIDNIQDDYVFVSVTCNTMKIIIVIFIPKFWKLERIGGLTYDIANAP